MPSVSNVVVLVVSFGLTVRAWFLARDAKNKYDEALQTLRRAKDLNQTCDLMLRKMWSGD